VNELRGTTVLALGLGRSGCAAAALMRRRGAVVLGGDDAGEADLAARWQRDGLTDLAAAAWDELHAAGRWQQLPPGRVEAVVLSPGVPADHPGLLPWRRAGVPIHGELEWAARLLPGRSVAVTGTNGKSTVTAWIAHVLRAAGRVSPAVGNLGTPLAAVVEDLPPDAIPVIECSSFQLETIDRFRPDVGVCLNLAADHLDRYPSLAAYHDAKARLARHVADDGAFVTATDCTAALAWPHAGRRLLFGDPDRGADAWWRDGWLEVRRGDAIARVVRQDALALASPANLVNATACAAALLPLLDDLDALGAGLASFPGLPHRHELVGVRGGVRFVNDSKATNVHAVRAGLDGYPTPVVLIAGGRGKGEDYAPLREVLGAVRAVVTLGEEGPAIAAALAGAVPCEAAADLPAAVARAADLAEPDATVLLSPACASFDMFPSYRERGAAFARAAVALGAQPKGSA
jgi:UDP-N-acetylmuramoylalanine--D-glutamate ligase